MENVKPKTAEYMRRLHDRSTKNFIHVILFQGHSGFSLCINVPFHINIRKNLQIEKDVTANQL